MKTNRNTLLCVVDGDSSFIKLYCFGYLFCSLGFFSLLTVLTPLAHAADTLSESVSIAPDSFSLKFPQGATRKKSFSIKNNGTAPFNYLVYPLTGDRSGLWHHSSHRSYSGSGSWYFGIEGQWNYDNGSPVVGFLTSVPIIVPVDSPILTFWQWRDAESPTTFAADLCLVYIGRPQFPYSRERIYNSKDQSREWNQITLDLSSYAGQEIVIGFEFFSVDEIYNQFEGWYIDDVQVGGKNMPLGLVKFQPKSGTLQPGEKQSIKILLDSADLPVGEFNNSIWVLTNPAPLEIPLHLEVIPKKCPSR